MQQAKNVKTELRRKAQSKATITSTYIMTGKLLLLILISICLVECAPRRRGGFRFRSSGGGGVDIEWWHVWIILIVFFTVFATIMFTIQFGCYDGSFKADKPMEERDLKSWGDVRKASLCVFLFFTGLWLPVGTFYCCYLCCCSSEEHGLKKLASRILDTVRLVRHYGLKILHCMY